MVIVVADPETKARTKYDHVTCPWQRCLDSDSHSCYSGRAPAALTLEKLHSEGYSAERPIPHNHGFAVTVPGAAAAWVDTVEKFGSKKVHALPVAGNGAEDRQSQNCGSFFEFFFFFVCMYVCVCVCV